ncbi:hypothetical protein AB0G74_20260 [Streptomyces sp. NPDC020875]|uniref:hypothetical protein n=1 Tax=Streptomyces sp. NPDC020875 TaxID=3154898 RepID=UPI0033C25ADE
MPVRSRTAPRGLAVALALLALGTAACGNGGMPVDQGGGAETTATARPENTAKPKEKATPQLADKASIRAAESAIRAFLDAPSVTLDWLLPPRKQQGRLVVRTGRGKECLLEINVDPGLSTVVMRTGDGAHYMKMNEARVRSVEGISPEQREFDVGLFADRWVESPDRPTKYVRTMTRACDIRTEMREFVAKRPTGDSESESDTQRTITEDGQQLLVLSSSEKDTTIEFTVTTGPEPTLRRIQVIGGKNPYTMTISALGKPLRVYHPAPEDVLTVAELEAAYKNAPDRSLRNRV